MVSVPAPKSGVSDNPGDSVGLLAPLRAPSLTTSVSETIRRAIIDRTLPPGSPVSESELATQLGVSKTPVREALLHLRQVGLIEGEDRRTPTVVAPGRDKIVHAYQIREALEVFAASTTTETATAEEIELLAAAARQSLAMATAGDTSGYRVWDLEFHRQMARAVHNPRLAELVETNFDLILALRERDLPGDHFSVQCAEAHVRIAEAIATRDAQAAGRELRAHIHTVRDHVLRQLSEVLPHDGPTVS
jgi:DNA-binding GntR family transcriptional regulator